MTAYASALHEHCAGLLQFGGPEDCMNSIRCMYLMPDGTAIHRNKINANGSNLADATFLAAQNTTSRAAGPVITDPVFWKQAAAVLQLKQPTCVPLLTKLDGLRFTACSWQQLDQPGKAKLPDQLPAVCKSNPKACFVVNASIASDMSAWWLEARPQRMLEDNSSWRDPAKLQRVSEFCADKWAARGEWVKDACATRGVGSQPWNNSLMLNRMVVALVDAFESSACNNTVAYSEAMAVQKIVADLCNQAGSCPRSEDQRSSGSAAGRGGVVASAAAAAAATLTILWMGLL